MADEANALQWRAGGDLPLVQEVLQHRVKMFFGWIPGLVQAGVKLHLVHGADGRIGLCICGQQDALGVGKEFASPFQELTPTHLWHALVNQQERDRFVAQLKPAKQQQRLLTRRGSQDAIIGAISAPEVSLESI
jgi:hypothetical protein